MRSLAIFLLTLCSLSAMAQSWRPNGALANGSSPPQAGQVYFYATGCTGTSCSGPVSLCLSSNSTSCNGTQVANTSIFYTLDGTPANEASTYYTPGSPISIPDPSATQTITVNAVLVQTTCTSGTCNGYTGLSCSTGTPCHAEVIQDGMNTKSWLKMNVACAAIGASPSDLNCPASVFTQASTPISGGTQSGSATTPTVQHGGSKNPSTCTPNLGVRGVPTNVWYYVSQPQPTVDIYTTNSSLAVEMDLATTASVDCLGGSSGAGTGDTEDLVPVQDGVSILPLSASRGCDQCTVAAASFYTSHVYAGSPASATTLWPANLSELEMDDNWQSATAYGTSPSGYGYGTFNVRCSMDHASPVVVGGKKYGQFEYSSQNGGNSGWAAFPGVNAPTHDCDFPFGTISSQTSSSTSVPTFTPGTTNTLYNGGETAYGLEPGFLFVDQDTSNAESELLIGPSPGATPTAVIRGVGGTTPHSHSSGAFAVLAVKVQVHATRDLGAGASGCIGTVSSGNPPNAMYFDYLSLNGNYYGTAAYQSLMGANLPVPSISILSGGTWGTQTLTSGHIRSKVCSYFGSGGNTSNGFDQKQPYMKPGTGNAAKTGIADIHDNFTLSWGIVGSGPSQIVLTQTP